MVAKHCTSRTLEASLTMEFKFRWWFARIYPHIIALSLLHAAVPLLSNSIPAWIAYLPSRLALFSLLLRAISFGFYLLDNDSTASHHRRNIGIATFFSTYIALVLQLRHPLVAAGVRRHGRISMRRLLRTILFLDVYIYGSQKDQEKVVEWLRGVHRRVEGTVLRSELVKDDQDAAANAGDLDLIGAKYGFTEDLQIWVLATTAYSYVWYHQYLGRPLSEHRRNEYCSMLMMIAHRLGVPAERLPLSYEAMEELIHQNIARYPCTAGLSEMLAGIEVNIPPLISMVFKHSFLFSQIHDVTVSQSSGFVGRAWFHLLVAAYQFIYDIAPMISVSGIILLMTFLEPKLQATLDQTFCEIGASPDDPRPIEALTNEAGDYTKVLQWFLARGRLSDLDYWVLKRVNRVDLEAPLAITIQFWAAIIRGYYRVTSDAVSGAFADARLRLAERRLANIPADTLPVHMGIVMDGNRRWARVRGMEIIHGHVKGAWKLLEVLGWWMEHHRGNLKYMTFWTFSTDNFNRPESEVNGLMRLLASELGGLLYNSYIHFFKIRVVVIGDRSRLAQSLVDIIEEVECATAKYDSFFWQIAVAYGGQDEIVTSVNATLKANHSSATLAMLSANEISRYTYNGRLGYPRVNIILRTGGDHRTSGFLLWDSQYAELKFSSKLWPEFEESDFVAALVDYSKRDIRLGK
ncbi:putative undecaprenyl diphosphate synthase-domain-containing protein [Jimgerdemannia flammicorona]|uniref:Putative undecaprenyl diphosphate synthase-domain-containing protein n=1 Tax=Jimgerdemannia flammicorona TaxID=994334 RepID=A0A433QSZ5_9FUNG|nr:putative undecaprenyl diphosphate synthase-domain-containing protein [Jimgerdemannia flammicorona]